MVFPANTIICPDACFGWNSDINVWGSRYNILLTCIMCGEESECGSSYILVYAEQGEARMILFAQRYGIIILVRFARTKCRIRQLLLLAVQISGLYKMRRRVFKQV